ncbi:hypothetical protein B296_00040618 [Ensete ventricosum]|uniref:Uncharacterized protein n=1 Tax=Ensete ventricosum TaxID=4639 RepID=A0A426ZPM2_ENSVE|nr:hypothetical protein B296_00040618 [Ensete ventricosum]
MPPAKRHRTTHLPSQAGLARSRCVMHRRVSLRLVICCPRSRLLRTRGCGDSLPSADRARVPPLPGCRPATRQRRTRRRSRRPLLPSAVIPYAVIAPRVPQRSTRRSLGPDACFRTRTRRLARERRSGVVGQQLSHI